MIFMVLSSITGLLLLYAQPLRYYGKVFFWMKMGLMALAGLNALAFHLTAYRSVAAWDTDLRHRRRRNSLGSPRSLCGPSS